MSHLVVDIGNTRSKLAVFRGTELISLATFQQLQKESIKEVLDKNEVKRSIISSVSTPAAGFEDILDEHTTYIRFSSSTPNGITNNYASPETLGLDRLAAVIGASSLFPGSDCLVIDAGTCITYDFISAAAEYDGGSISPGLEMRFKAMNAFTGRLPLLKPDEYEGLSGTDTPSSMQSGVINGMYFELLGFVNAYIQMYPSLRVLLCGGDAAFFDGRLKNSIFAGILTLEEHLVLKGLNEVIRRNDKIN